MMKGRGVILAAIVVALATAGVRDAAAAGVFCAKKKGNLFARENSCKAKETLLDLSQYGLTGPPGAPGAPGAPGNPGPAGPTLYKRTTFTFATVSPQGSAYDTLASLDFTPPTSGTALVRGRGYCNMNPIGGSDNEINIGEANALNTFILGDLGVVNVPNGSPAGLYQPGWSTESEVSVTAGVPTTATLLARHENGNTSSDCSGSLTVEVFTGTLP